MQCLAPELSHQLLITKSHIEHARNVRMWHLAQCHCPQFFCLTKIVRIDRLFVHLFFASCVQELSPRNFRSEEHTSELQSLMRTSFAVFCLNKNKNTHNNFSLQLQKQIN